MKAEVNDRYFIFNKIIENEKNTLIAITGE